MLDLSCQTVKDYQNGITTTINWANDFLLQDSYGFIWGIDYKGSIYRYDGSRYLFFENDPDDSHSLRVCVNGMAFVIEDQLGKIWISTPCFFTRYDPLTDKFEYFDLLIKEKSGSTSGNFRKPFEDGQHNIWIGGSDGAYKYDTTTDSLYHFEGRSSNLILEDDQKYIWYSNNIPANSTVRFKKVDPQTNLIIDSVDWFDNTHFSTSKGFFHYSHSSFSYNIDSSQILIALSGKPTIFNIQNYTFRSLENKFRKKEFVYPNIKLEGDIILGTSQGRLLCFNPLLNDFINCRIKGIKNSWIRNIIKTQSGILIITTGQSTHKLFPHQSPFQLYPLPENLRPDPIPNGNHQNLVEINGNVYFNTYEGFVPIRPKEDIDIIPLNINLPQTPIPGILIKQDTLRGINWIIVYQGTEKFSLYQFDKNWKLVSQKNQNEFSNYPRQVIGDADLDKDGKLWIQFWKSLSKLEGDTFFNFTPSTQPQIQGELFYNLLIDSNEEVWIGYYSAGLTKYTPSKNTFQHFNQHETKNLSHNKVNAIVEDLDHNIWIATDNGLNQWVRTTDTTIIYTEKDGLLTSFVFSLIIDGKGTLWGHNRRQLFRMLPGQNKNKFVNYTMVDGLPLVRDIKPEAYKDKDGYLYFPCLNNIGQPASILTFHPDSIPVLKETPSIQFLEFRLAQETVKVNASSPLKRSINQTDHLILKYNQNDFSIIYSAPYFVSSENVEYAYQLEGHNQEWQYVGDKLEAIYTNLDHGQYIFKVKVTNHHGQWSVEPRSLKITILPPWWLTWWAKSVYLLITYTLLFALYRYLLKRRLAEAETRKLKEINQVKNRLFTNITHEFRTPLTLIQGVSSQIETKAVDLDQTDIAYDAQIVHRNGAHLLNLVNQILDLQKLESGKLKINWVQRNIITYIKYILDSFHTLASDKNITLHFLPEIKELTIDYDPEKLLLILSNLLSNAIKFTPERGQIYLTINHDVTPAECLRIQIKDTGIGIPEEKFPLIFDRFYQADNSSTRQGEGTGIGLTLTKELVELLNGSIKVDSEPQKGTAFEISLPIHREAPIDNTPQTEFKPNAPVVPTKLMESIPAAVDPNRALLLIVEDNPDLQNYLSGLLDSYFDLLLAANGQQAMDLALEHTPDLIISDIMMPLMDGFELCQTLKLEEATSHIPIILLTAKADLDSRIEGIQKGADAYLTKPFNRKELFSQINTLLTLRKNLQEKYGNFHFKKNQIETPFLLKVKNVIENHLSDSTFGLPQLCSSLGLSRSQVFRKLKALTGKSTTQVIRSIRLQKAKKLLANPELNISEIAFEVGYMDPAYFTRNFTEEFGQPPSTFRK